LLLLTIAAAGASTSAPEKQVIRIFHLENLPLNDGMTMVRALVGATSLAAHEELNSLIVRDSAAKVEVIGELLRTIDKPRGEVAVRVDLLYLDAEALARGSGEANPLAADEVESLRRTARRLTSQELNVLDGDRGRWILQDKLAIASAGAEVSFIDVGFELEVVPRVHAASEEVTLDVAVAATDATRGGPPAISNRRVESGQRVRGGQSFVVAGLQKLTTGQADSWLTSRFDLPAGPGEVVLVLTPRIVRGPGFTESDLLALCIGTENSFALCGREESDAVARH
jgi:type II secretory pathway component GspD/PulD (secretin)